MIDDSRLAELFHGLAERDRIALAVSGGPDSMAMLHLADRWRRSQLAQSQPAPAFHVFTVDHGLRAEAADECRFVVDAAQKLGHAATMLRHADTPPATGVLQWAREIRYQLLATACHERGLALLMTAHHIDDQAETFLMRLARGSGVDGLAAMARESRRFGLILLRPLLGLAKSELVAELTAASLPYVEDPSNSDERYERARLRQLDGELKKLGLSAPMIALSAARLRQARDALDEMRDSFISRNAVVSSYGSARVDQLALSDTPFEVAVRVLARLLRICGGTREAPNLSRLETLTEHVRADFDTGRTLSGCRLIARGDDWLIVREAARIAETEKKLPPGNCVFWDNRYVVCLNADAPDDILAGPLGTADLSGFKDKAEGRTVPKDALASLLCLRRNEAVIAVPALDLWTEEARQAGITARFIGGDEGVS